MKIDTKKCTRVVPDDTTITSSFSPDHVILIHPNTYISKNHYDDKEQPSTPTKENKETPLGRKLSYTVCTVFSEKLTSARLKEKKSKNRDIAISDSDIDDLEAVTKNLDKLFLGRDDEEETEEAEKEEREDSLSEETTSPVLGRINKKVINYRTNRRYETRRSARIAAA